MLEGSDNKMVSVFARRAVIVSCTGNASSLTNLGESGADLVWGKPMPNFTNGEMQNELAPRLAESLARAQRREACLY